jgi:hypothetical protein
MLTIPGRLTTTSRNISRRDLLHVGGLAFGSLALQGLPLGDCLRRQAAAAQRLSGAKSVILIWLRGGASHIDSFDMKPSAPVEIRGEFNRSRPTCPESSFANTCR